MAFFALEENQAILRKFKEALEEQPELDPPVVEQLKIMLPFFIRNPQKFDQYCQENIQSVGDLLRINLDKYFLPEERASEILPKIFVVLYGFICERDFVFPNGVNIELSFTHHFVDENIAKFEISDRMLLWYALYRMPIKILKELLHKPDIANFLAFEETAKKASNMKSDWDAQIAQMSGAIEKWQGRLAELKTESNFVALDQGFNQLAASKKRERQWSRRGMGLLGALMLLPLVYELWFVTGHIAEVAKYREVLLYTLPALTGLELLLLYWFRVVLSNVRSLNAQLVQIELRRSLCQFIQSYADYSSKIKEKDKTALEKFENLIFSGIVSEGGAIPSTFDGVDQLAKLVSSVRSGKAG